ncbi:MAG: hypothetical protein WD646_00525 [Actinomycetota bacterium]
MITLEPIEGLSNRMRAIAAVIALCRDIDTELRVVWTRSTGCNCRFRDIFEPLPGVKLVDRGLWANRLLRRVELYTRRHTREIRQDEITRLAHAGYDFHQLATERSTFIQTYDNFYPLDERPFEAFVPVSALLKEIDRITSSFAPHTLGVHIRRGDHLASRTRSPTSAFVDRIEAELAERPNTLIYLATDSEEVETKLRRIFADRILSCPKTFSRSSVAGIRDAVVELYCLARTHRILGSYFSSYSQTAAQIGAIPLEVIDRADAPTE